MAESSISNKYVLNYFETYGKNRCVEYLKSVNKSEVLPVDKTFEKCLEKLSNTHKKLLKSRNKPNGERNIEEFFSSNFIHPEGSPHLKGCKINSDTSCNLEPVLRKTANDLAESQSEIENLNKQLKLSEDKLHISNEQLHHVKLNLKRTKSREVYTREKLAKLEENNTPAEKRGKDTLDTCIKIQNLNQLLKEKDKIISNQQINLDFLEDIVQDIDNTERSFICYDEKTRRYNTSVKTCIYELLQHNVSVSKIPAVIESVLNMVNITPNRLPSRSTIINMNLQRLCLSQKHLAEVFSKKEDTTLLTDETSKFGAKFMGYEASDTDDNLWVLGLRDIETESAENTLKVFKEILADLNDISDAQNESVSRDVIKHICATLSDRAATEMKFNSLLESYRKDILPLIYSNYDTFTDNEKQQLESLCNFFCGLHSLVNLAGVAQSSILQVEPALFKGRGPIHAGDFQKDTEPGSCRLMRTSSKAFASGSGADEKSGFQGPFRAFIRDFLKEHNLQSLPLKPYRGSRFNVLFENASSVYFLHENLKLFLESYGASNRLLQSILHDLNVKEYLAGVKALGLISKLITCPLWHLLEDKSVNILDMNEKYQQLVNFLNTDALANVNSFMTGDLLVFGDDTYIEKNLIYNALIRESPYDDIVQTYLEILLPSLGEMSNKLVKSQLPGGELNIFDSYMKNKVKGTPKTSCFAESVFGQLGQLLKCKPSISTLAAEAYIMFANNKTLNWLKSKNEEERGKLISEASKDVKTIRKKFKSRLNEITENRREAVKLEIEKKEKLKREKIRKQEAYTRDILNHGLWQSEDEVDNMLPSYTKNKDKIEALKAQISFRKNVLMQQAESKETFNFSKKKPQTKSRQNLSIDKLICNLKILIRQAVVQNQESGEKQHILVGKRVKHRFKKECDDGTTESVWYFGKIISQVPWFPEWFNIIYDDDPAVYTYHRLDEDINNLDLIIVV